MIRHQLCYVVGALFHRAALEEDRRAAAMEATRSSVLVVDDDVDTCRNLSDILTDLGYHVDCAHDGPSALDLVRRNAYDVALLDLKMPGMDGLTLYREIKKLSASTVA